MRIAHKPAVRWKPLAAAKATQPLSDVRTDLRSAIDGVSSRVKLSPSQKSELADELGSNYVTRASPNGLLGALERVADRNAKGNLKLTADGKMTLPPNGPARAGRVMGFFNYEEEKAAGLDV
jgi:hypothetical protein